MDLPQEVCERLTDIHNSLRGHVGLKLCKRRFKEINKQRVKNNLELEESIPDRMTVHVELGKTSLNFRSRS